MGLNVTHTMNNFQFEKKEMLKNTAKDILSRQGASKETMSRIIEKSVFPAENYHNSQLAIIKASSQISLNTPLKETLKYLKSNVNKKQAKQPKLGELWELFEKENDYEGELVDFVIDSNIKNIFAAA